MTVRESTYDDASRVAELSSGQTIHGFHRSYHCSTDICPVHKPTSHAYRDRELRFNWNVFAFERIVPEVEEGFVPDPDDYLLNKLGYLIYKNAIRCNHCQQEVISENKFETMACQCRRVSVSGGHKYQKFSGDPADYMDTSVLYENGQFTGKV